MAFADKTTNKIPVTQDFIESGLSKNAPVSSGVLNSALGYISQNATPSILWDKNKSYRTGDVVVIFSYDTRTVPSEPSFNARHYLCLTDNKGLCPAGANAKISQEAINSNLGDFFYDEYTIEATPAQWASIWG